MPEMKINVEGINGVSLHRTVLFTALSEVFSITTAHFVACAFVNKMIIMHTAISPQSGR